MYDVDGKTVGSGDKGKIQEAVEKWEELAKAELQNNQDDNDDKKTEDAISEKIKNSIRKINEAKASPTPENVNQNIINAENSYMDSQLKSAQTDSARPTSSDLLKSNEVNGADVIEKSDDYLQDMITDQSDLIFSFVSRFIGCLMSTVLLIWLAVAPALNTPMPPYLAVNGQPSYYLITNIILLVFTGIMGFSIAFKGIKSLFTFKPDVDSLTSLAFYAALFDGVYMLFNSTSTTASAIYFSCAAACISSNLLGKIFLIARVRNNLRFFETSQNVKSGFYAANKAELEAAQKILRNFDGEPAIIAPEKVKYLKDYLEQSYLESPADRAARVLSPIVLLLAILAAVGEFLLKGEVTGAVAVFTAVCCIAAPLMLEAGVSVPFYRTCKRLVKQNALVTGCDTVSQFGGTDAIVADGNLIFPKNNIRIHRVKTFPGHDINEVMLYASSIACEGKSPLGFALLDIIADDGLGRKILKECEKIAYEDERGLSAIIDDKVVLLGNRGILRHHLIETPSHEFEIKNATIGKEIVYLAIEGKLCAMFIVSYEPETNLTSILHKLRRYGIQLLINSTDPNISPNMIDEKCGLIAGNTEALGAKEMQILKDCVSDGDHVAGLAFMDLNGYASSTISCIKLYGSMKACTAVQILFSLVGILLFICTVFLAGGIGSITSIFILAFQVLCAIPVLFIMLFRRN